MTTATAKALKAAIAVFLLLSSTACVSTAQSAPTMLDYSYIPPSSVTAATPNYGIDDF